MLCVFDRVDSVAEEALTAPLPEGWEQGVSDDGTPYHFNEDTGESMWEHPMDGHYKELFQNAKMEAGENAMQPEEAKEEPKKDTKEEPTNEKADDMEVDEFDDEFEFG